VVWKLVKCESRLQRLGAVGEPQPGWPLDSRDTANRADRAAPFEAARRKGEASTPRLIESHHFVKVLFCDVPHASPGSGGDSRAILLRTAHTSSFPPFGEAFPQTRFLLADPRSPPSATRPGSTFWHLPAALLYDGTVVRRVFLPRPHTDSGIAFSWAGTHAIGDVFQLPNFPTSQDPETPRLPGSQTPKLTVPVRLEKGRRRRTQALAERVIAQRKVAKPPFWLQTQTLL